MITITVCNSERESRHQVEPKDMPRHRPNALCEELQGSVAIAKERRVRARSIPFSTVIHLFVLKIRDVHHTSVMCGWESVSFRIHQRSDAWQNVVIATNKLILQTD